MVHCPGGAYPSYAHGYYARDNAFYQRWDDIAREREAFKRGCSVTCCDCADHAEFLHQLETVTA